MSIKLASIMAIDLGGGIGLNGDLPWRNRNDMRWFKDATMGKVVLISPTTYDSIPNGLPGRHVKQTYHQPKDENRETYLEKLTGNHIVNIMDRLYQGRSTLVGDLPLVIGGKKVYESFEPETVTKFITVIPGRHEADTKVDLDKLFDKENWNVRFMGGSINHDQYCYLIILDRKGEDQLHHGMVEQVNKHFEPYVKLTLKEGITLKPGCHGVAKINEIVAIPKDCTGVFSIRLSLAKKGLYTSGQLFRRNWIGYPEIVITNKELTTIELPAGAEIGELGLINAQYRG